MDIVIEFLNENWELIVAGISGLWAVVSSLKALALKLRIKIAEANREAQEQLLALNEKTNSNVLALTKSYASLAANAKMAKARKIEALNALKGFADEISLPDDEVLQTVSATEEIKKTNKTISEILEGL